MVKRSSENDNMTGRYLVLDVERLRIYMCQITEAFVELLGINEDVPIPWNAISEVSSDPTEYAQLQLPLGREFVATF